MRPNQMHLRCGDTQITNIVNKIANIPESFTVCLCVLPSIKNFVFLSKLKWLAHHFKKKKRISSTGD